MVLSGEFEKMDLVSAGYSTLANICFIFLPTYPADFADIPQPFGISGDDGGKRCKLRGNLRAALNFVQKATIGHDHQSQSADNA